MGALFFISGNDDYLIKEHALKQIIVLCGEPPEANPALEIIRGDNDSESPSSVIIRLMDSISTYSLFSSKKIIWVKHFNRLEEALDEPSTKSKPSPVDRLANFLKDGIPDDTTIVWDTVGMDRRKSFFKVIQQVCNASGGSVEWLEKVDAKSKKYDKALPASIKSLFMEQHVSINDEVANYLAMITGGDTALLYSEIQKIITYCYGEKYISIEDCKQIATHDFESVSWNFTSALTECNRNKALELIPHLLETMEQGNSGSPYIPILASIMFEFKNLAAVKCEGMRLQIPQHCSSDYFYRLNDSLKNSEEKQSSLFASMHPFRAYNIWKNASNFSEYELTGIFQKILKLNHLMVSSSNSIDMKMFLELITMEITEKIHL